VALVDGSRVEEGDAIVALRSNGVHANGFSLVRQILEAEDYRGDDLLAPTRLYLDDVRMLKRLQVDVHAFVHVTGGGIEANVARVLPDGLRAEIFWDRIWEGHTLPVFQWLARHVDRAEMQRVFNLGVGFCAIHAYPNESLVIGRIRRA
jgi:phosphoribosylformylglycinamidine cyclo-ligase